MTIEELKKEYETLRRDCTFLWMIDRPSMSEEAAFDRKYSRMMEVKKLIKQLEGS